MCCAACRSRTRSSRSTSAKRDEIGSDVLDPKTVALPRLAALVAIGGALPTYSMLTDAAIGMGATPVTPRC